MRIRLSNGAILEGASLINTDGRLFLYIPGDDMRAMFELLMNSAATASMTFEDGTVESTYEGYTRLTAISSEGDGLITAVLRKEIA